jgi:hypothetical protein
MNRKIILQILLVLFIYTLVGCASGARYSAMIPDDHSILPVPENFFLKNAITLKEVTGGEETNPMWTSEVGGQELKKALEESLRRKQLLTPPNTGGKYNLSVNLEKVDQPMFGFSFTVTSTADYLLRNNETKDITFDQKISASYTATFGDAAYGPTRLKLANEGSIRENIRQFIEKLLLLN